MFFLKTNKKHLFIYSCSLFDRKSCQRAKIGRPECEKGKMYPQEQKESEKNQ